MSDHIKSIGTYNPEFAMQQMNTLYNEVSRLRATLAERDAKIAHAKNYLSRLITSLHPNCIPLEDLTGQISQIDNITTEISKLRTEIEAMKAKHEWEPISDKHKDGETWWLADARSMDIFACGYWDDEAEAPFQWRISDTERLHNDLFTHAMKPTQPAPEAT